jgi:UDP-N-acetylglucosamine 1-carboxyvinyltransferase
VRASILFAGPMVARLGRVALPPPGGDVIGRRRVDTHFQVLAALGARSTPNDVYEIKARPAHRRRHHDGRGLGHGDGERADGRRVDAGHDHPAQRRQRAPRVQPRAHAQSHGLPDLDGIGTNTLVIHGVDRLGGCDHTIESDYLEIGSFIGLAAVTNSDLTIERVAPNTCG